LIPTGQLELAPPLCVETSTLDSERATLKERASARAGAGHLRWLRGGMESALAFSTSESFRSATPRAFFQFPVFLAQTECWRCILRLL